MADIPAVMEAQAQAQAQAQLQAQLQAQQHAQVQVESPVLPPDQRAADAANAKKRRRLPSSANANAANQHDDPGDAYQQLKRRRKIEPRGVPWFVMLERLKQYRDRYGSLNVPSTFRQDPKLASWVQYQRYLYHHKEIADERKAALDECGFEWSVLKPKSGGKKCSWDEQLDRVAAYKEANGNTLIPYSYQTDPSLGFWVSKQRKDYKHGQLSEDKVEKLNQLGFQWKPPTGRRQGSKKKVEDSDAAGGGNRQSTWDRMFEKLRHFQTIHGSERAHSRSDLNAIDKTLATWIKTQRHMYTIKKMAPERVARLESIGFAWRVGQDWKDFYARLKDYKDHYGTCDFPANEDARLAAWIDSQRVSYKYRELSKERVDKLKSIGFSFAIDEGLEALEASAPPVDDDGMPSLIGGKVELPQGGMVAFSEQAQESAVQGDPTTNIHEYNIAMHLAGLAVTKAGGNAQHGVAVAKSDKEGGEVKQQSEEEGTKLVLVDGMDDTLGETAEGDGKDGEVLVAEEQKEEAVERALPVGEGVTHDGNAVSPSQVNETAESAAQQDNTQQKVSKESEAADEEDELLIQIEIVDLQEDKVRLQEEKVIAQQEKLLLIGEIKSLEARHKDLTTQVKDAKDVVAAGAYDEKTELKEKARLNEEQLSKRSTQIKEQEERLRGLQQDLNEML